MFEEVARFVTFRFWRKDARTWSQGLMVGAGHGGIESLLLGLLFVINMVVLAGISRGYFTSLVPQGALPETLAHLDALIALPWYDKLLGGVERVLAIILHLSLSLMVLRAARKGSIVWLVLAILWHATFNAVALIVAALTNAVTVEAVLALLAAGSLLLILRWRDEPQEILEEETAPASPPATRPRRPLEASDVSDRLDETRYF
jgi:uncharacterized membrane protein YhfC